MLQNTRRYQGFDIQNAWTVKSFEETLTKYDNIEVKIEMAKGHVCPRCWNIVEDENEDGLCDRCADAIK